MDTDAKVVTSIGGFVALLLGWLHLGTRDAKKIAESVSAELSRNYMTAEKVEKSIEKALETFKQLHLDTKTELKEDVQRVERKVDRLIDRELDKK